MVHWHNSQSIKPTAYLEGNHWEVICHFFFGIWKSAGGRSCYLERNEILLTCRLMPSFLFQPQELLDPGYLIILGREKKKRWGKKKKKKKRHLVPSLKGRWFSCLASYVTEAMYHLCSPHCLCQLWHTG